MRSLRLASCLSLCFQLTFSSAPAAADQSPVGADRCESFALSNEALRAGTPAEWSEASRLLLEAFPSDTRKAFLDQGGSMPECATTQFELKIFETLQAEWNLGSDGDPLTADLAALGYRSASEQIRILLAGAYSIGQKEQLDRVVARRAKLLADEDLLPPQEPIPADCRVNDSAQRSSMRVVNGYSRALRWVVCTDASVRTYLWERGWFVPSESDMRLLCIDPVGDEKAVCTRWNDDE